ncbi:hypothetical protein ACQ4LE_006139 [Meloidogyne hapla]
MESLLYGQIIDTLKYLDFEQLFALKQTNKYFKTLIGRYEHLLARKEFSKMDYDEKDCRTIDLKSGVFNFPLTKLENKWQSALDRKIPTYLSVCHDPLTEKTDVVLNKENNCDNLLAMNLPVFPKNIEELKIIYCWLFHLFGCAYSDATFINFIFNPELIQLLFEENIQLKFNTHLAYLNYFNPNSENVLKFNLEHLLIVERLLLNFENIDNTNKYNYILLNLVLNGGYVISEILLNQLKQLTLHNLIINLIETSKDCSKMVANLLFNFDNCPRINLSIRTKEILKIQNGDRHSTGYKLSNIYNPNVRYSIVNIEKNGLMNIVNIERIN